MSKGNGSNGHAPPVIPPALPVKTATFRIGGEDLEVPAIGFLALDENEDLKTHVNGLSPDIPAGEYIRHVLAIVAVQVRHRRPELTYDVLLNWLLAGEGTGIITAMSELIRISGFQAPEPTETPPTPEANPGTGTSTGSAPS